MYRLICRNISLKNCWISLDAREHCIAILYLTGIKISCLNHLCIVQSRRERVSFLSYLSIICKRVCWAFPWHISYISFRLLFPNATTSFQHTTSADAQIYHLCTSHTIIRKSLYIGKDWLRNLIKLREMQQYYVSSCLNLRSLAALDIIVNDFYSYNCKLKL